MCQLAGLTIKPNSLRLWPYALMGAVLLVEDLVFLSNLVGIIQFCPEIRNCFKK